MVTKTRISITINPHVYAQVQNILKGTGIKFSSFVEATAQAMIDSETKPMKNVYENLAFDLIERSKLKRKKRQEK